MAVRWRTSVQLGSVPLHGHCTANAPRSRPPDAFCPALPRPARRFAASRRLLTVPRLAFATASTGAVLVATLPPAQAAASAACVLAITVASGYYGTAVIGGVVGDYLGATIAISEVAVYLVIAADWQAAAAQWQPLALLAAVAALPVIYTRRVIIIGASKC
jgi:hypothetical protein